MTILIWRKMDVLRVFCFSHFQGHGMRKVWSTCVFSIAYYLVLYLIILPNFFQACSLIFVTLPGLQNWEKQRFWPRLQLCENWRFFPNFNILLLLTYSTKLHKIWTHHRYKSPLSFKHILKCQFDKAKKLCQYKHLILFKNVIFVIKRDGCNSGFHNNICTKFGRHLEKYNTIVYKSFSMWYI